jgi:hypothetical protein
MSPVADPTVLPQSAVAVIGQDLYKATFTAESGFSSFGLSKIEHN